MKYCTILLFVFSSTFLRAQPAQDSIDAFITRQMKEQQIAGLSVGIIEKGRVIMANGYGLANIELSVPATEQTVYMLASVSKHMIAVGIMQLAEQGKLLLSDPCNKYFTDAPPAWQNITIRHLLNHTSGLPRESPAFRANVIQHDSILIRAAYSSNLVFATGTKWQYCNLGYFMLADIIRRVSGKPFQQYMAENVFEPNGLRQTVPTNARKIIPNRADGYEIKGKDSLVNVETYLAFRPSGAFVSNVSDMLKWEMLMQESKLLSKETWQQMWNDTVSTLNKFPDATSVAYGYGWFRTFVNQRTIVYHAGSLPGFRTMYYRFPEEQTAIIVLTNTDKADVMKLAQGIASYLTKK